MMKMVFYVLFFCCFAKCKLSFNLRDKIIELDDNNVFDFIENNPLNVVLFFYKPNCDKCDSDLYIFLKTNYDQSKGQVVKINIERCPIAQKHFNVTKFPKYTMVQNNVIYKWPPFLSGFIVKHFIDQKRHITKSKPLQMVESNWGNKSKTFFKLFLAIALISLIFMSFIYFLSIRGKSGKVD